MNNLSTRKICSTAFILCMIVFASAYWVQYKYGLAPCPLCMLQRFAMGAFAAVMLIALIHNPKSRKGSIIYGILGFIFSGLGLSLALRQVWLQHQPPDANAACLPGLPFLFQSLPFGQAIKEILHGSEECGRVRWHMLGLSLPEWSAILFVILLILMLVLLFKKYKKQEGSL